MKFSYAYKSSDGARHEDVIEAPSRDEAFQALRERGIRPIKVVAADGTKANGAPVRSVRRRVLVVVLLAIVSAVLGIALFIEEHADGEANRNGGVVTSVELLPRMQLKAEIRPASVFDHPSEVFLSQFAQPAKDVIVADDEDLLAIAEDLEVALVKPIAVAPDENADVMTLKRIVIGIKQEAAMIVRSGRTTLEALRYFIDRQQMEVEHRRRLVKSVESGELSKAEANAMFRTMGFREID